MAERQAKLRRQARIAEQVRADGRELAARLQSFVGLVAAHFEPGDVPADIANAALSTSASLRTFGRSIEAYLSATE